MSDTAAHDTDRDVDQPAAPKPETNRNSQVIPMIALMVSLVTLAVAGWAAVKPDRGSSPSFGDEDRAAAEERLCAAVDTVRRGVSMNVNATAPGGPDDVVGGMAVMANARLALSVGGQYLMTQIDPAAPDDLAEDASELATTLMEIGATATAGVATSDPEQMERMNTAEELTAALVTRCSGN